MYEKFLRITRLLILSLLFTVSVTSAQSTVVVVPLGANSCPNAKGEAIAGPALLHNYCWYLSAGGASCDTVCSDIGGENLANSAENKWPDSCNDPTAPENVAHWFYENGNPGTWTGPSAGSTSYHALGYGYENSDYYGKCSTGTATGVGTYPGDLNNNAGRNIVCACDVVSP